MGGVKAQIGIKKRIRDFHRWDVFLIFILAVSFIDTS